MGYTDEELRRAQKGVTDYLASQRAGIEPSIARTQEGLSESRARMGVAVSDIMGGVAGKYGISSDIATAGKIQYGQEGRKLQRQSEETLGQRRLSQMRDFYNESFNYSFNQLVQAGYDEQAANDYARQHASEVLKQQFSASDYETDRIQKGALSEIKGFYGQQKADIGIDYGNPYANELFGQLARLGTTAATYGILNRGKTAMPTKNLVISGLPTYGSYFDNLLEKPTSPTIIGGSKGLE